MQITMRHAERLTLAQMREFLDASNNLSFAGTRRKQIYGLEEDVLGSLKYLELPRKSKGIVRLYPNDDILNFIPTTARSLSTTRWRNY